MSTTGQPSFTRAAQPAAVKAQSRDNTAPRPKPSHTKDPSAPNLVPAGAMGLRPRRSLDLLPQAAIKAQAAAKAAQNPAVKQSFKEAHKPPSTLSAHRRPDKSHDFER